MFYPHYARGGTVLPPYVREKQLSSSGFSLAAIKIPGEGNLYSFSLPKNESQLMYNYKHFRSGLLHYLDIHKLFSCGTHWMPK